MVRAAEELIVTGVLIEMTLHPGYAQPAEHIVVHAATVAAVMAAPAELNKCFVGAAGNLVVEG